MEMTCCDVERGGSRRRAALTPHRFITIIQMKKRAVIIRMKQDGTIICRGKESNCNYYLNTAFHTAIYIV